MSNNNSIITTIIGVAGLVGLGYGFAMHTKLSKVSERLDRSIDSLADDMEIDIPEELVNKAVEKAVASAVKTAVDKATNEAVNEVRRDIRREVANAVEKEYDSVKDNVLKEVTVAASKIDVVKVRKDVEEAAKKMALEKFDANLEGILEKFSSDWDNTAKIYSAIKNMVAPTPAPSSNREFVVRVG